MCGRSSPRIHDGSPVTCTIEHSSAGMLDVLERGGDRGVVVGERQAGVRVAVGVGVEHGARITAPAGTEPARGDVSGLVDEARSDLTT